MKYTPKMRVMMAVIVLAIVGMAVPVMANGNSSVTPPQIITLAPISLSAEMREKYSEQTVLVKVKATVSELGIIDGDIKIITSSGDEAFDQAVTDSLKKSVFRPAFNSDNKAVACSIIFPLQVKVEKYLPEEKVSNEAGQATEQPTDKQ
ncbi:Gram-negative bacterial tonB protein [Sporomusa ovata DSM 2662]|uniref:TonB C-terminal domain-containing protein n=1 Tax=Sporomusa ovata TaxID=2378 RepID=A0A0U1L4R2_9FIRM|nr:energy transducer TonB [Sporomusa ovata]EQB25308.1 TonB domain-containing protein [Sporomusa ovata DSM 2662]CQR73874.1 hypothetical protein SpAn4DRAFT_0336 [Sporomusa ovata]